MLTGGDRAGSSAASAACGALTSLGTLSDGKRPVLAEEQAPRPVSTPATQRSQQPTKASCYLRRCHPIQRPPGAFSSATLPSAAAILEDRRVCISTTTYTRWHTDGGNKSFQNTSSPVSQANQVARYARRGTTIATPSGHRSSSHAYSPRSDGGSHPNANANARTTSRTTLTNSIPRSYH